MIVSLLRTIENYGNRLPHPTVLFFYLCLLVILLSILGTYLHWQAIHPLNQELIVARSLFSQEGVHYILTNTVKNFTGFAPLGTVLVAMLGIGLAEKSGMLSAVLKLLVSRAPRGMLSYLVVFAGVLSSLAADSGYVVLIPLSALLFLIAGRNPLLGIAAAFAGVSGGYSANLLIGPLDIILSGISSEAIRLVDPDASVSPLGNYYFIVVSTLLVTVIGGLVTEYMISPLLQMNETSQSSEKVAENTDLSIEEKQGLKYALWSAIIFVLVLCSLTVPENALLRDVQSGSLVSSPFVSGIVVIISIGLAIFGLAYSKGAKTLQQDNAVVTSMEETMATMAGYLVLMFFAAQFVNYFNWTNIGAIIAIKGAGALKSSNLDPVSLLFCFVLVSAAINLFIGSASAKWAIMAPIFVPMLALLGVDPAATQMAYRIGDSSTNIITPLMPYFALVVAFAQRYEKDFGVGNLLALMLPYSIAFLLAWLGMLCTWLFFSFPLGPV